MQQNDKSGLWNKYVTKVVYSALSSFDLLSLLWRFGLSIPVSLHEPPLSSFSSFCVAYMLFHQCYISTVTRKPRSLDDEVATSGFAATPQMQITCQEARFTCHFYWMRNTRQRYSDINGLWKKKKKKASDAIQLCLEQHLSIRRESGGRDERREGRMRDAERKATALLSVTQYECITQTRHNYCLIHFYENVSMSSAWELRAFGDRWQRRVGGTVCRLWRIHATLLLIF